MNKKKNKADKYNVEVILVVPLGVEDFIFPWGVYSLRDYIGNTCEFCNIKVWDYRIDNFYAELHNRYINLLNKLFFSLKQEEMDTFLGLTINPYVFLGVVACTGVDFFKIAGRSSLFRRSCFQDLRNLKSEFEAHIAEKIGEYKKQNPDATRIWGLSVYDRTLFNSLYIARLIKQCDPTSSIILGGDYFDFQSAEETMKSISFLDGIAVGYGEDVMRKIVLEQQKGIPIRNLRIQGLVNSEYIKTQGKGHSLKAINVPPIYKDFSSTPLISYVQQQEKDEIRILAQRGCSWGKCTFCTQIDKELYFPIPFEQVLKGIQEKITTLNTNAEGSTIRISFDSDENSIDMLVKFIKYLNSLKDYKVCFDIKLWFQVKSFRKELAEALNIIDNERIRILFVLNFESLNFDTLRNMRKGHSPLQAIESAKAIQDCGCTFRTNYLIHYPLENSDSIDREAEILKRAAHLLIPPKGVIISFPYYGNNRDDIYKNQEKYKVKIKRMKRDNWLKNVFGIELPFSFWVYSYDQKISFGLERLLVYTYHKKIKARDAIDRPDRIINLKWGKKETQLRGRKEFFSKFKKSYAFSRSFKFHLWNSLYYLLQLLGFGKGKAFWHRIRIFTYLSKLMEADTLKPDTGETSEKTSKLNVRQSHFYLEDDCLKKEYNGPGKKEKWSLKLSSNELKILRYLYWTRKRKKVMEKFKDEISETEISEIIDRHIKLGSLVRFKNLILCVFNDPGFWKETKRNQ